MITLLTGDNSFELKRALNELEAGFDGVSEKLDGETVTLDQLPDLLQGSTLFANKRLVVIDKLSDNKSLWDDLVKWVSLVSDDVHLVLIESKPDKRTKTYKELKKSADVREFAVWTDRERYLAEKWVVEEASRQGINLHKKDIQQLVARIGVDQWHLYHALQKLSVLDVVNAQVIEEIIEANPVENVFNLLEAALSRDTRKIHAMILTLQRSQDAYMTFGLLMGQAYQMAALSTTDKKVEDVATEIGAHPYALVRLAPHVKRIGRNNIREIVSIFADTDIKLKSTIVDPWLLVEEALIKTASA